MDRPTPLKPVTDLPRSYRKVAGDEPLPGYRLLQPLGRGGFGEVWECEAPGGLRKAVKFVRDDSDDGLTHGEPFRQEFAAFQRIRAIRHPFLLTLERVELVGGDLVMVMELADRNLADRYDECAAGGLPGVPRDELLGYLSDAAEALDVMSARHNLQHLDVKPANLFLVGDRAKVGDYGLVRAVTAGQAEKRGLTPRYVAPEVLHGRVHPRSDQYSLALVYCELLTGIFPYQAKSAAHMLFQHATAEPDLRPLPAADRPAVRRALSKNPADRWPSCVELMAALLNTSGGSGVTDTVGNLGSSLELRRARIGRGSSGDLSRGADSTVPPRDSTAPASGTPGGFDRAAEGTTGFPFSSRRPTPAGPFGPAARWSDPTPLPTGPTPADEVLELTPAVAPSPPPGLPTAGPFAPPPRLPLPGDPRSAPAPGLIRLPRVTSVVPVALLTGGGWDGGCGPTATEFADAMVRAATADGGRPPAAGDLYRTADGGWECRMPVKLGGGMLELKVAAFREFWGAELDWPDPCTAVLRVCQPAGLFDRLAGRKAGAEVTVKFPPAGRALGEAVLSARLFGKPTPEFARVAGASLPKLLDEARTGVQNMTDRRAAPRVPADFPMQVFPVTPDGEVYPAVWARCRDVSVGGVCFAAAGPVPTGYVYAAFTGAGPATGWAVLTRLLRAKPDGGVQVIGGRFRTDR